jgi:hypothetical protein
VKKLDERVAQVIQIVDVKWFGSLEKRIFGISVERTCGINVKRTAFWCNGINEYDMSRNIQEVMLFHVHFQKETNVFIDTLTMCTQV